MTAVNIVITDDALVPDGVAGVVVSFYDPATLALITLATTDADGLAAVSLPDATYEVRSFKSGYAIAVAQIIVDVLEPTNTFDATAENLTALPIATDPRLCRCTGTFVNFEGRPTPRVTFRLMARADTLQQTPKIVDGKLVFPAEMALQTDAMGTISIDLFRGGGYYVTFSGDDDTIWNLVVPDRSSVNLIDLIFPAPVSLSWDPTEAPGSMISVAVGETKIVPVSLLFTDFQERNEGLEQWIQFMNSDSAKMDIIYGVSNGAISITGLVAGSAEVTIELRDPLLPSRIPPYAVAHTPLLVTITA